MIDDFEQANETIKEYFFKRLQVRILDPF